MWDPETSSWFGHQMLDGVHGGNMEVQGKKDGHLQKQNCSLIRTAEALHLLCGSETMSVWHGGLGA